MIEGYLAGVDCRVGRRSQMPRARSRRGCSGGSEYDDQGVARSKRGGSDRYLVAEPGLRLARALEEVLAVERGTGREDFDR